MKYAVSLSAKFKKDIKRIKKQNKNLQYIYDVISLLASDIPLDSKYEDHPLIGNYKGFRECHITPDWLLIYIKDNQNLILTAVRTGSHSDLF